MNIDRNKLTPMMKQYFEVKDRYPDCILFFRLGDFYEMFFEDAIVASKTLEIALTGKSCGLEERAPMCGIPFHSANSYISKLVESGYKVAIGEQLDDPQTTKGIVRRDVIRVVTPGTVIESNMLDEKKNNYIMSIYKNGLFFGMSVCDISTGDFFSTQIKQSNNFAKLLDEISRYSPAEIVVNEMMYASSEEISRIRERFECYVSRVEDIKFEYEYKKLIDVYNMYCEGKKIEDAEEKILSIIASN